MDFAPALPYAVGTAIALVLTLIGRRRDVAETYCIVTGSWLAWIAYIVLSWWLGRPDFEPWYAGIVIDATAAWMLYRHPSNKIKATIAAIFCLQIIIHMAYGALKTFHIPANGDVYADYLSITGWLELLLLGGWSGGIAWRRIDPFRGRFSASRRASHHRDMGAP